MRALALPLILTLFIAGCTSSTVGGGTGIAIQTFETDFSEVYSSEPVTFNVLVKNTGSVNAQNVKVKILGLDGAWKCPTCGGDISSGHAEDLICELGGLLAGRPDLGTTGEVRSCSKTYTAPAVPQGLPVTYQPFARVTYTYGSSIVKTLNVGSSQELRRIEAQGLALPAETSSITTGPVSIEVNVKGPIRFFGSDFSFPIEIIFSNVGGGTVCEVGSDCSDSNLWNRLRFVVKLGGEPVPCGTDTEREITLFRGQTNTVTCTAKIQTVGEGILQKTIQVESAYDYLIDAATSVKVNSLPSTDRE